MWRNQHKPTQITKIDYKRQHIHGRTTIEVVQFCQRLKMVDVNVNLPQPLFVVFVAESRNHLHLRFKFSLQDWNWRYKGNWGSSMSDWFGDCGSNFYLLCNMKRRRCLSNKKWHYFLKILSRHALAVTCKIVDVYWTSMLDK